nr:partitioning defective 3 homolog B-like [Meriones unguiculatus]
MCCSGRPVAGTTDRIQKLRKEYYQARREGFPFYENEEGRTRPSDHDLNWVSGKGPDGSAHNLRSEGMECQYASLPRGGSADPADCLTAVPRGRYNEREIPYYPGPHLVHPPRGGYYPRPPELRVTELRYPQYYPPPPAHQHKGPFRQDVPPSPPQHQRVPAYQEMGRAGPRGDSPDRFPYRNQDPRQKNPMTAAV